MLRRWNGADGVAAAPDLPDYPRPCSPGKGLEVVSVAFDLNYDPVVVYGDVDADFTGAKFNVRRYSAGSWQAVGPDNGVLPRRSAFASACAVPPVVRIGADNAPAVAYRADNSIVVQRLSGNQWVGVVAADADVFAAINGTYDLALDPGGSVVFAWGSNSNLSQTVLRARTTPAPATWEPLGPNGGVLPLPGVTRDITHPRIRFDTAGHPVIGANAGVYISPGVWTGGTAVYRFDGSNWQGGGGYRLSSDSYTNAQAAMGFTLFEGEAVMAWVNTRAGSNMLVAQRNTVAGWSAIGEGDGAIAQLYVHGLVSSTGWQPRPLVTNGELYLALVENTGSGAPQRIQLFKLVK